MINFTIISVGYNCYRFADEWFRSISNQTYRNWNCIVVLDPSQDDSEEKLKSLVDERFHVVVNKERKYCLRNTHEAIQMCGDPDNVCVTVDLDDAFSTNKALAILNNYYNNNVWLTYGTYQTNTGDRAYWCRPIAQKVWDENSHRKNVWSASHLRTFRKWLWNKINPDDFLMPDGKWIRKATDRAFMYPMLEMAGSKHVKFVKEVLYMYRLYNQQKAMHDIEMECLQYILGKQPYEKLEKS
jgi:glycosyltransferase involved in cell wall biosynthesis